MKGKAENNQTYFSEIAYMYFRDVDCSLRTGRETL